MGPYRRDHLARIPRNCEGLPQPKPVCDGRCRPRARESTWGSEGWEISRRRGVLLLPDQGDDHLRGWDDHDRQRERGLPFTFLSQSREAGSKLWGAPPRFWE